MVRVPAHSGEDVQELVRRIVSAVLEDHGAPEQDIEPDAEVPGGATLDNAKSSNTRSTGGSPTTGNTYCLKHLREV